MFVLCHVYMKVKCFIVCTKKKCFIIIEKVKCFSVPSLSAVCMYACVCDLITISFLYTTHTHTLTRIYIYCSVSSCLSSLYVKPVPKALKPHLTVSRLTGVNVKPVTKSFAEVAQV